MDLDSILVDLEIIKKIKEDDKLAICILPGKTKIYVHTYSLLSRVTRWYRSYNRENTIDYLENLLREIEKAHSTIIQGTHSSACEKLKNALTSAIPGLSKLKITYDTDSNIAARITLIIDKISDLVEGLEEFEKSTLSSIDEVE